MSEYENCPRVDYEKRRTIATRCPHGCGTHCERNAQVQRRRGKELAARLDNLTWDDIAWCLGVGRWGQ